jgi:hypothetical protein
MLQEGDIIEIKEGHKIYADIPEHFVYENKKGSFKLTHNDIKVEGELKYFVGKYIVYKTTNDGGGMGSSINDFYPDGHHVFCERLDNFEVKIDFYQSGSFTAMIKDINPIGRAKRTLVE